MVVSMCRVGSTRFCGDVAQVGLVCLVEVEVVIVQVCILVILQRVSWAQVGAVGSVCINGAAE